jgi:hypothetical protein
MRCGFDRPTKETLQPSIQIEASDSQTGRSASSAASREVQCKPVFQLNSPKSDLSIVRAIAYLSQLSRPAFTEIGSRDLRLAKPRVGDYGIKAAKVTDLKV